MNVLVIPEDFRKDQYILKPIMEALFSHLGKPRVRIRICQDPLLGGVSEALNSDNLSDIVDRYRGMVQLFLLCVDRDGNAHRRDRLDQLETEMSLLLNNGAFIAENAWQELEVWVLAGHDLPPSWNWREIRNNPNPKENYYIPCAKRKGVFDQPGEGRKALAAQAARRFDRILALCPEDIGSMIDRINEVI